MFKEIGKRILALSLVGVMTLSSVAFAASDNSINKVPTVEPNTTFEYGEAPEIRIEEDSVGEFNGDQTFRLRLTNAEWIADAATQLEAIVEDVQTEHLTYDIQFEQRPGSYLEIYLSNFTNSGTTTAVLKIPLLTTVIEEGEVKVVIDSLDSTLSDGTYTFAVADVAEEPEYGVDLSIDSVRGFDNGEVVIDTITLIEDIPESILLSRYIRVDIVNDGFEFASTNANLEFKGGFSGNSMDESIFVDGTSQDLTGSEQNTEEIGELIFNNIKIVSKSNAQSGIVQLKFYGKSLPGDYIIDVANYLAIEEPVTDFTTTASINKIPSVAPKYFFSDDNTAPLLRIEFDDNITTNVDQNFQLKLVNATWPKEVNTSIGDYCTDAIFSRVNNRTINVNWNHDVTDGYINIPLISKVNRVGDVKVIIVPKDSSITKDTLVFAKAIKPGTMTNVYDTIDVTLGNNTLEDLMIDEKSPNSIQNQIKLVISKGYKWTETGDVNFSGGINGKVVSQTIKGRTLTLNIEKDLDTYQMRGSVLIEGLKFAPLSKTTAGIVKLTVSGPGITKETIEIGNYDKPKYGATIYSEQSSNILSGTQTAQVEPVQILSGTQTLHNIVIEEEVPNGLKLFGNRKITLQLPKGFAWANKGDINGEGGLKNAITKSIAKSRNLTLNLDYSNSINTIGRIIIEEAEIKAYKSAPEGKVKITVKGNGFKYKVLHIADKVLQLVENYR